MNDTVKRGGQELAGVFQGACRGMDGKLGAEPFSPFMTPVERHRNAQQNYYYGIDMPDRGARSIKEAEAIPNLPTCSASAVPAAWNPSRPGR